MRCYYTVQYSTVQCKMTFTQRPFNVVSIVVGHVSIYAYRLRLLGRRKTGLGTRRFLVFTFGIGLSGQASKHRVWYGARGGVDVNCVGGLHCRLVVRVVINVNLVGIGSLGLILLRASRLDKLSRLDLLLHNLIRLGLECRHVVAGVGSFGRGAHRHGCRKAHLGVVRGSHRPFHPQHLPKRVLIAMTQFKVVPCLPELWLRARITQLRAVCVDPAGAINLTEFAFKIGEFQTHFASSLVRENLNGFDVQIARDCDAKDGRHAQNVQLPNLVPLCLGHRRSRALVHFHGVTSQPVLFLKVGIEKVDVFCILVRNAVESLFKELACSFNLCAGVPLDKLDQIHIPNLKDDRPLKERNTSFIRRKGQFKVLAFFQKLGVIENHLWRRDS
eukprot:m.51349 g.51349  ORF g.51349 m.51349 type:complete len:387 (-) comp7299_c0_seq1:1777-2937(-)